MWKFKYCGLQAKILSGKTKVTVLIGLFIGELKPPEFDQFASFSQAKGKFLEPEQGNSIRCSAFPFAIFSLCQASNVSRCNVWLKLKLRGDRSSLYCVINFISLDLVDCAKVDSSVGPGRGLEIAFPCSLPLINDSVRSYFPTFPFPSPSLP